jgi:hypothetical protein
MSSRKPMDMTELDITIRNSLRAKLYNARPAASVRETLLRRAADARRRLWLPAFAPAAGANLLWHTPRPIPDLGLAAPVLSKLLGFPRQIL